MSFFYVQVVNVSNILQDALYLEQSLNCYLFKTASGIVEDGYCSTAERSKEGIAPLSRTVAVE